MPRPRKNDPTALIAPILAQFAERVGAAIEKFTTARITKSVRSALAGRAAGTRRRRRRAVISCYYPYCRNVAAPRFGMFCAAEHKGLSKAEKLKYRAKHNRA